MRNINLRDITMMKLDRFFFPCGKKPAYCVTGELGRLAMKRWTIWRQDLFHALNWAVALNLLRRAWDLGVASVLLQA
jgi:hypothetical protein